MIPPPKSVPITHYSVELVAGDVIAAESFLVVAMTSIRLDS